VAPFNEKRVRQALLYSVDKDVVNKVAYFNSGSPAFGPVPPPITWAFDPNFTLYKRDVAKAKQLLAEACHPDGVPFAITVVASPLQLRVAQIIQAQEAGFKVSVRQVDATSLITVLQKKDFDISWSPWTGRPDPDGNMYNWFTKGGPNNFSGYSNDDVDSLMKKARASADQTERRRCTSRHNRSFLTTAECCSCILTRRCKARPRSFTGPRTQTRRFASETLGSSSDPSALI